MILKRLAIYFRLERHSHVQISKLTRFYLFLLMLSWFFLAQIACSIPGLLNQKHKIVIWCFSSKLAALRSESKDWLTRDQVMYPRARNIKEWESKDWLTRDQVMYPRARSIKELERKDWLTRDQVMYPRARSIKEWERKDGWLGIIAALRSESKDWLTRDQVMYPRARNIKGWEQRLVVSASGNVSQSSQH